MTREPMSTVETIKTFFVHSGASWVLWLLFALSAGSVAIVLERWFHFRSKDDDVRALAAELDAHLAAGSPEAALEALRPLRSVGASVARAGLRLAPRGIVSAEKGMLINQGGMRHGTTDPRHTEPEPALITKPIDFRCAGVCCL